MIYLHLHKENAFYKIKMSKFRDNYFLFITFYVAIV